MATMSACWMVALASFRSSFLLVSLSFLTFLVLFVLFFLLLNDGIGITIVFLLVLSLSFLLFLLLFVVAE